MSQNTSFLLQVMAVVVASVGLVSLCIPGCPDYRPRDPRIVERLETEILSQATAAFYLRFGHLPPRSSEEVQNHFNELSGSITLSESENDQIASLDDAERVVFWLGGKTNGIRWAPERVVFMDFDIGHFVDRDEDGFYECTSQWEHVYEYDPTTTRVSCDFSDDEMVAVVARQERLRNQGSKSDRSRIP